MSQSSWSRNYQHPRAAQCYDVILNFYITSNQDIRCGEDIPSEAILCASSRYRNRRAFQNDQRMYDCKTLQFSALHHLPAVPESIESDFAPRGGTWFGISNVRTRQ